VGYCECVPVLQRGGALPGLHIQEGWRRQGIGSWLVRHAVAWLRLAGCDRVVISMTEDAEAAGAGRFFQRFGWEPVSIHPTVEAAGG
jgi:GNAT superfamily N-acetyltransferase